MCTGPRQPPKNRPQTLKRSPLPKLINPRTLANIVSQVLRFQTLMILSNMHSSKVTYIMQHVEEGSTYSTTELTVFPPVLATVAIPKSHKRGRAKVLTSTQLHVRIQVPAPLAHRTQFLPRAADVSHGGDSLTESAVPLLLQLIRPPNLASKSPELPNPDS